jgi:hypothetical protein
MDVTERVQGASFAEENNLCRFVPGEVSGRAAVPKRVIADGIFQVTDAGMTSPPDAL